jgi:hypothetical protein
MPPVDAARIEELINYFHYFHFDCPQPKAKRAHRPLRWLRLAKPLQ